MEGLAGAPARAIEAKTIVVGLAHKSVGALSTSHTTPLSSRDATLQPNRAHSSVRAHDAARALGEGPSTQTLRWTVMVLRYMSPQTLVPRELSIKCFMWPMHALGPAGHAWPALVA